ncbi:hypothetical protein [Natronococcus wangiae]|nr:hypothetical protein [Natronococcus sp. AD5]
MLHDAVDGRVLEATDRLAPCVWNGAGLVIIVEDDLCNGPLCCEAVSVIPCRSHFEFHREAGLAEASDAIWNSHSVFKRDRTRVLDILVDDSAVQFGELLVKYVAEVADACLLYIDQEYGVVDLIEASISRNRTVISGS